ncbi:alpha/beta fold hydrolase [Stenomitos frigidus]|uniref:Alpha/beta hydrolase n=1 Tax=Stenomitos frigidus ULC18 TaxID=2107698 RepID=A0A2T1EGA8_9CYAN|nr:alpha/beta hydrolase [Stenomitos frigidus]PSB31721.1 alpha/beta hydrolase [Stenomitos frigidus ULC18]
MQTIDILGVPHAYNLTPPTASKDILVFIHGWLLSRSYWQPLIEQLSPHYQCLSYDLRGFGDSQPCQEAASNGYSLIDYAQDLALLLKQLQLEKVWLVGHSIGGSIALWAADQQPQVKGVVCLNSGGGIYLKAEFDRFRAAGQQLVKMRPRWLCQLPLLDLLFTRASVARAIERRWGRQRLLDFVVADAAAALGMLLDSTTEAEVHRLPQVVARLQQPVYFIAGAQDPIMEPQYVRHLASFHPLFQACGANVAEIADCGHMAMVEQTTAVAAQLQAILARYKA